VLEELVAREGRYYPFGDSQPTGSRRGRRPFEGLVGKDPESPYVGGRTVKWLKVKQPHYREGERGWEPVKR
jgi:hypothetical protein